MSTSISAVNDYIDGMNASNQPIKITPLELYLAAVAVAQGVLGDWATVRGVYQAANKTMRIGSRVIGSDGKRYKLIGNTFSNDPTTDSNNWQLESVTGGTGGSSATNISLSLSGNTLNVSSSTGNGDSQDLSQILPKGVVVSSNVPTTPTDGVMWKSNSSTPKPYGKNCVFVYNQGLGDWNLVTGDMRAELSSVIAGLTGGAFNILSWTASSDNAGGTLSGNQYTVGSNGLYDVSLWIHPSSDHDFNGSGQYNGLLAQLLVDGVAVAEGNHVDYGNSSGNDIRRPVIITIHNVPLSQGQNVQAQLFLLDGTFNATISLRITRRV